MTLPHIIPIALLGLAIVFSDAVACFFLLNLMVGIGALSIEFFLFFMLLILFAYNLYKSYKAGTNCCFKRLDIKFTLIYILADHPWNVHLVAIFVGFA